MDESRDELEIFQSVVTESLQQFLTTEDAPFNEERTNKLLETLPSITEKELEKLGHKDSVCSVCMQSFLAILAEEESATVMVSPAFFSGELGITQLNQPWQCGHLFCRRDVTKWIKTGKLTCPLCRQSLIEPGNEHEPQSWQESDPDVGMHMFVTNGSVDLDRFLSGMHSIDQSTQRGDDNGSDSVRHEYSGMYS